MLHLKNKSIDFSGSSGFSILEIVIAIAIFTVMIFVVADLLKTVMTKPQQQLAEMDNIGQVIFVSSRFANEIRAAAYGSYPLIKAEDSEIIFYSPIGAAAGNVNRIRYYISGDSLYRGVIVPVGGIYNPAAETITPILDNLSNEGTPLFYYYDGTYDGLSEGAELLQPGNVNQVKFVKINLVSAFTQSAGATIRVLKNNLSY